MTHLHWSEEKQDNQCPHCTAKTILIIAPAVWRIDDEDVDADDDDSIEIGEEITAHYCLNCQRMTTLTLNG